MELLGLQNNIDNHKNYLTLSLQHSSKNKHTHTHTSHPASKSQAHIFESYFQSIKK